MVGLNKEYIIECFIDNDYIITENFFNTYTIELDGSNIIHKKYKFLFIKEIYRSNHNFGGIIKINKKNFKEQITKFNFKEIYVYFENPKGDHTLRVQLKHFMEHFNFYFPNTKKHIILEKKM